jgi:hypothetical protein
MKTGMEITLSGSEVSSEDKSFVFDRNASYFTTGGKLSDMFDSGFKLQANFTVNEATDAFFVVGWRGMDYLLATIPIECEEHPCSGQMWVEWKEGEEPTIQEWLESLGEPIPTETTNYRYMWKTGYMVSETEGYITDSWSANLVVETATISEIPWNVILPVAAVGVVGLGVVLSKRFK